MQPTAKLQALSVAAAAGTRPAFKKAARVGQRVLQQETFDLRKGRAESW